jgi:hypothetical protein
MYKKVLFIPILFLLVTFLAEDLYSQDTLKGKGLHPHYNAVWPYDLEFNKDFSTPDSIISSEGGEIRVSFEHDTLGNIYNIFIYAITLRGEDDNIIYDYQSSIYKEDGNYEEEDKDRMYYMISNLIHEYIYNEMKLIRNEKPFFRNRYHVSYTIRY